MPDFTIFSLKMLSSDDNLTNPITCCFRHPIPKVMLTQYYFFPGILSIVISELRYYEGSHGIQSKKMGFLPPLTSEYK